MKQIASAYTYNKTTGVITLTGVNIDRDQLLLIVNTTRNVTYYNFADSATTLQAFTKGANTSLTLNSSVITASSAHANGDALTIYYDDQASTVTVAGFNTAENFGSGVIQPIADAELDTIRSSLWIPVSSGPNGSAGEGQILSQAHPMPVNIGLNELPYIKININVANSLGSIASSVYLRRIGEYSYESIRYQGGEDEAYLKVYLDDGDVSTQRLWRLSSGGSYAGLQGIVAFRMPQNAGSNNGDTLPPQTGWSLATGITGTVTISYEQPTTTSVDNAGWKLIGSRNWNSDPANYLIIDTTGYSEIRFQSFAAGGVTSYLEVFSPTNGEDYWWSFGNTSNLTFSHNIITHNQYVGNMYVTMNLWDDGENQTTQVFGRTSVSTITANPPQGTISHLTNFTAVTATYLADTQYGGRTAVTVFNEGPGTLYISPKNTVSTSSYMVRLSAGEYWECPTGSLSAAYWAVFGSAGTARVTQIY
jgi:hypothetical protein